MYLSKAVSWTAWYWYECLAMIQALSRLSKPTTFVVTIPHGGFSSFLRQVLSLSSSKTAKTTHASLLPLRYHSHSLRRAQQPSSLRRGL